MDHAIEARLPPTATWPGLQRLPSSLARRMCWGTRRSVSIIGPMSESEAARKAQALRRVASVTGAAPQPDGRDYQLPYGRRLLVNFSRPIDRGQGVATFFLGLPRRIRPGDVSVLLLGDADFVMAAEVLLQYEHLFTRSSDGRATPFFQLRNGHHWIRLAAVDRWVSLDPYRDAYLSLGKPQGSPNSPTHPLGVDFRPADEASGVKPRDPFEVDPDLVDRGTRGHATTVNRLADHITARGHDPRLPGPGDPQFDLAWLSEDAVWVTEVKSVTAGNMERQLRLGLGQLLRYRFELARRRGCRVVACLVVEQPPTDITWSELCDSLGVVISWPGAFPGIP